MPPTESSPRNPGARAGDSRPTVYDVARASGLSRGTISRFLNGNGYVSPAARAAISAAIDEVGYAPNAVARSLAMSRTGTILFVIGEANDPDFSDPNLTPLITSASARLSEADLQLVTLVIDGEDSMTRLARLLRGGWADAVILASTETDSALVSLVGELGLPAAMTDRPPEASGIAGVEIDNRRATAELTRRILDAGRARPVMIGGPVGARSAAERRAGFLSVFSESSRPAIVDAPGWTSDAGADAMRSLLAREPQLDAVVAASDSLAFGAIDVLRAAGRSIPEDVGVAGFDDIPFAAHSHPQLTTVRQPFGRIGSALAELVIDRLGGDAAPERTVVVPTTIVWRGSV